MSVIAEDRKVSLIACAILNARMTRGRYPAISASWETFKQLRPDEAAELEADAHAAMLAVNHFDGAKR